MRHSTVSTSRGSSSWRAPMAARLTATCSRCCSSAFASSTYRSRLDRLYLDASPLVDILGSCSTQSFSSSSATASCWARCCRSKSRRLTSTPAQSFGTCAAESSLVRFDASPAAPAHRGSVDAPARHTQDHHRYHATLPVRLDGAAVLWPRGFTFMVPLARHLLPGLRDHHGADPHLHPQPLAGGSPHPDTVRSTPSSRSRYRSSPLFTGCCTFTLSLDDPS